MTCKHLDLIFYLHVAVKNRLYNVLNSAISILPLFPLCRVMVLDSGRITEYDSPTGLLSDHKSTFYSMAKDAGLA